MVRGYVLELQPQTDFDAWLNFTHLGRGSNVNSVTEVDMLRSLDYKPWAFLSCFSWMKLLHLHNVKLLKSSSRHAGEFAGDTINTESRQTCNLNLVTFLCSATKSRAHDFQITHLSLYRRLYCYTDSSRKEVADFTGSWYISIGELAWPIGAPAPAKQASSFRCCHGRFCLPQCGRRCPCSYNFTWVHCPIIQPLPWRSL